MQLQKTKKKRLFKQYIFTHDDDKAVVLQLIYTGN